MSIVTRNRERKALEIKERRNKLLGEILRRLADLEVKMEKFIATALTKEELEQVRKILQTKFINLEGTP